MIGMVSCCSFRPFSQPVLLFFLMLTAGCSAEQRLAGPAIRFTPHENDVIEVLLRSEWVPMNVHPSCRSIGEQDQVPTIGAYVSALLVSQAEGGENWVNGEVNEAEIEWGKVWRAAVTFHSGGHREDVIEFLVLQDGGRVIPESFRCKFFLLPWSS
jgi:hypothetical protein